MLVVYRVVLVFQQKREPEIVCALVMLTLKVENMRNSEEGREQNADMYHYHWHMQHVYRVQSHCSQLHNLTNCDREQIRMLGDHSCMADRRIC